MSSNHEWQNQCTKQRISDARRMADVHRQAKSAGAPVRPSFWAAVIAALRGLAARPQAHSARRPSLPRATGSTSQAE